MLVAVGVQINAAMAFDEPIRSIHTYFSLSLMLCLLFRYCSVCIVMSVISNTWILDSGICTSLDIELIQMLASGKSRIK